MNDKENTSVGSQDGQDQKEPVQDTKGDAAEKPAVQHVLKAVGLILLAPASAGLGYAAHIGRHLLHLPEHVEEFGNFMDALADSGAMSAEAAERIKNAGQWTITVRDDAAFAGACSFLQHSPCSVTSLHSC